MIIDKILDRKDGDPYTPKQFYNDVVQYGEPGFGIASAMDDGDDLDVKNELCAYIIDNDYNMAVCDYIRSVNWL